MHAHWVQNEPPYSGYSSISSTTVCPHLLDALLLGTKGCDAGRSLVLGQSTPVATDDHGRARNTN